jgi:hypothetical protein
MLRMLVCLCVYYLWLYRARARTTILLRVRRAEKRAAAVNTREGVTYWRVHGAKYASRHLN